MKTHIKLQRKIFLYYCWPTFTPHYKALYNSLLSPSSLVEYCDQFVCLCVCLCPRAYHDISGTARLIFMKFFLQIPCGHGSVLLWRCCDTLCTSGFMDDVMFGRTGPYGDTCDTGAESDAYECLVNETSASTSAHY